MNHHFADRLIAGICAKGNALCVGLDPRWEALPQEIRSRRRDGTLAGVARAYEEFCERVIDVVAPLVAVVKAQSAFFEACGPDGLLVLQCILRQAQKRGLITILDGKRNDIAATAEAYAQAAFAGVHIDGRLQPVWDADALTVNPYLGRDSVEAFLHCARKSNRGVFILARTSNPGAGQFQDLESAGQPLFMHVALAVGSWARENLGRSGFGDVGAVVAATRPAELAAIRRRLPESLLLLPGFGAQGATAADTAAAFRHDGLGALVHSSRSILFAFTPEDPSWEAKIEAATREAIDRLAAATPMGRLPGSSSESAPAT